MARLWSSGIELNSSTDNVEWSDNSGSTISTTTIRSGTYAIRCNPSAGQQYKGYAYSSTNITAPGYFRFYFRIASAAGSQQRICVTENTAFAQKISIRINTDNTLQLYNEEDSANIGSASSALSTNTWYRIELSVDTTTIASTSCEALIDGVSFATGTVNLATGIAKFYIGNAAGSGTFDFFYDDIAINNSTGSFQNSYPGEGEIIHLRPNADGDTVEWNILSGTGDYTALDEVTPDDISTGLQETTSGHIEEQNLAATPAAMDSDDVINVVQVGCRIAAAIVSGTQPTCVLRIKASSGGTVEESASITFSSATWSTNAFAVPRNHQLTLYDLPGASTTAWTKSDLDTSQTGIRLTNTPTGAAYISTIWLLVDHKPAAAAATTQSGIFMTTNTSFFGA